MYIQDLGYLCGLPYVQIGGAHLKIIKTNESEGAVVRNRFKILFTKTLKPCKIICLLSTHPPKIIYTGIGQKYQIDPNWHKQCQRIKPWEPN